MELKPYQKLALSDLKTYLEILDSTQDIKESFTKFWEDKGVRVGFGGVPYYNNTIKGTPHLCFKVPTGGGKTIMACASIKPIFSKLSYQKEKVVVWLVPSDAILSQTIRNLKNVEHPYRQKIDADFGGKVEIFTKQELLNGQNFNPSVVRENLCIMVLSFDSLRIKNKEGRKVYQQNGNLNTFSTVYANEPDLVEGADNTALIQILNKLKPVVIVDESHNATSTLSVDMLVDLNPTLILDLTATPKSNSNVICYVDAMQLKKHHMVKLPVIVYNNKSMQEVLERTIELRANLEREAVLAQKNGGEYIRPIVLFQAQPKINDDSESFEKLKEKLIKAGIPEKQIAIKTSNKDELKNVELLSETCPIRFIITVNALKEGWDCPFAYILASLANRSSKVEVEQILGRVLRQPYAKLSSSELLNMSYVLTSSEDFRGTIDSVVKGLNNSGFSKDDYRIKEEQIIEPAQAIVQVQQTIEDTINNTNESEEFLAFDDDALKQAVSSSVNNSDLMAGSTTPVSLEVSEIIHQAQQANNEYNNLINQIDNDAESSIPSEVKQMGYKLKAEYCDSVNAIRMPQFMVKETGTFFDGEDTLFDKSMLLSGFSLKNQDSNINFDSVAVDLKKIDIEKTERGVQPKATGLSSYQSDLFKKQIELSAKTKESMLSTTVHVLFNMLNKLDELDSREIKDYIQRVLEDKSTEQLKLIATYPNSSAAKIKTKIQKLERVYARKKFSEKIEAEEVYIKDNWAFPSIITPLETINHISKSLYEEEDGNLNKLEYDVITAIADLDNVEWWHRNADRREFVLNGNINHYPDFIVKMKSGKIILVETKGNQLENDDSSDKVKLGKKWQALAGSQYRYFMVFREEADSIEEALQFDEFIKTLKKL